MQQNWTGEKWVDFELFSRDYKENGETKTETTYTYSELFVLEGTCVVYCISMT